VSRFESESKSIHCPLSFWDNDANRSNDNTKKQEASVRDKTNFITYLKDILKSPITTWWGAVTFLIEVLSFIMANDSIALSKLWILVLIFIVSFSLFVGVLVLIKGWEIYSRSGRFRISRMVRVDNVQVFELEGSVNLSTILEIYRTIEQMETSIGFIEVVHHREDGKMQAIPVWILPGHLRDIEAHNLAPESLKVSQVLGKETIQRWVNAQADQMLDELLRRGRD
jgi:hypothetical protein